jgi:vacuolar-type H+-ATPase subunit H
MVATAAGEVTNGSLDALKRVKATESEWENRIAAARAEVEATLRHLREEGDAAVRAALAEVERERTARLERGRSDTESEIETILSEGRSAAELAARLEGRRPADKRDAILETVLGPFQKNDE